MRELGEERALLSRGGGDTGTSSGQSCDNKKSCAVGDQETPWLRCAVSMPWLQLTHLHQPPHRNIVRHCCHLEIREHGRDNLSTEPAERF